jgi:hypothetical protein
METPVQWEQRVPLGLMELPEEMPKARVPQAIQARKATKGFRALLETPARLAPKGRLAQPVKQV